MINWIIHENRRIRITSLVLHNKHHLHFWTSHREWLIALRVYWLVFEPIINRHLVPHHTASPLSIHSAHLSQIQVENNCRNSCNYIHMIWLYYFNISGRGLISCAPRELSFFWVQVYFFSAFCEPQINYHFLMNRKAFVTEVTNFMLKSAHSFRGVRVGRNLNFYQSQRRKVYYDIQSFHPFTVFYNSSGFLNGLIISKINVPFFVYFVFCSLL